LWIATLSSNGALVSCNAGFPPPFCVPMESDDVRLLEVGGPLAGVVEGAEYHDQTLRLLPGDAVIAVSDGVLRSRDATGQEFGPSRAEDIAIEERRQPLDRIAEAICQGALEHGASSVPVDDLMVFAVRYSRDG
jgi:serine phosphatase RsbU (regulator of sigma subunit)